MTYKLSAHLDGDAVVLDEPPPSNLKMAKVTVLIEERTVGARAEELAQSEGGFVKSVLLDEEEDVWSHD